MGLLNWNPTKGNPHEYEISKHSDIISVDAEWEMCDHPGKFGKPLRHISMWNQLKKLSDFSIEQSEEIFGVEDGKMFKYIENIRGFDVKKPVTVWLNYPLENSVKATIFPLVRKFDESDSTVILDHIGYYALMVSCIYSDIYMNYWKDVGIYGHGFSDLVLEAMLFHKNNEIQLYVGS
jgi:hypothetical protein